MRICGCTCGVLGTLVDDGAGVVVVGLLHLRHHQDHVPVLVNQLVVALTQPDLGPALVPTSV